MWENLNESVSQFCSSKFWDTNLTWNSADPDFTVCFEKTFLVWIPCAFLWLLLPLEIYNFRTTRSFRIAFNLYNVFKLAIIAVMMFIATTDIVYYTFFAPQYRRTIVDIDSSAIKFFTFGLALVLTYKGPNRGIRTSGTLFLFSLLLVLCGAPQFRSELRSASTKDETTDAENYEFISYVIYYPLVVTLFLLNCFVDARPTATTYPMVKNACPENHVSFLSQILFSWFDGFMWTGYKRPIRDDDIWNLDYEMSPKEIARKFEPQWYAALDRSKNADSFVSRRRSALDRLKRMGKGRPVNYEKLETETDKKRGASIMGPLFRTFGFTFTFGVLMKLLQSVLQFASPVILKFLIAFVSDKEELMWHGYLYSVILLLTTVLQVIFLMKHLHSMYIIGIQIRTALVTVIYKKALVISSGARKDFTIGQIVNLMAVDAQRFVDLMTFLPLLAVVPLEIFLCMYFLWDIIGPSVLAGLALLILLMPLNAILASRIQKLQIGQMKRKDDRVKLIDEILSGIKVLKLYAWEPSFEREVTQIRDGEVGLLKSTAYLTATGTFLFTCTPFLVTLVTFAAFVLSSEDHVLTPEIAFVSLSLFNILRFPMTVIPVVLSNLVQTYVAVKRIDRFLNSEELDAQAISHEPSHEPVIIKNGQFSWDSEQGVPSLCDINVEVKKGSLVAVVGSVGAGKSSLLSAILGEMYKQTGTVNTHGKMAYVPQQAWIRNATLRDNITFGDTTDNSFYHDVVEACALKPDFKILPGGDHTEIGEKGINLSGGQKQRISLARAVFSKADIHLLDDPLSAVDSHVGKHIFDQVIGPNGLLKDKTRILVTHSIAFLPQVDHIIVLVNGSISEAGTYDELIAKAGGFSNFLASHQTKENGDPHETEGANQVIEEIKRSEEQAEEMPMSRVSLIDEDFQRSFFRSLSNPKVDLSLNSEECAVEGQKLIHREKVETGNVKWSVFLYYLRASSSFLVILTILTNVSYQLFSVISNLWLSVWSSDTTIVVEGHQDMDKQYLYLGIYGVLGFGQAVSVVIQVISMFLALLQAANFLHKRLLTSVLHWPVTTFDTIPSGRIMNRFGFDVDVLDNVLPNNLVQLLNCTASVISTLFMICYSTPAFISVIIPLGAIYFCVQRFYAATSRQLKRLESATKSPVYSHFGETVSGAMSIRAYGLQSNFIEVSEEKIDHNQKCSHLYFVAARWLALRLELLGSVIVMFSSLFVVLGRNAISGSLVGLSLSYSLQITETLFYWAKVLTETETNIVAAERIKEYSEVEQEAPWTLPGERVPQNWPDKGAIAFEDFRVRYREGLGLVLKGVTFHVNGGEKVGIVGRTGAGKSSLSLCLFRLLESAGGRILIDGIDVSSMGLHTLRSRLTIIPQDPVLFTGTLRMNLDPGESYADESLWRALTLANLKTTVSNSSSGLNHEISEGGGNFSVGQRQLICLARALLRKTKILILDEATAAVDLETDDLIQNTIKTEFAECTVLTVAHRLNTVLDYDKIIVLDQGRLVEYDSPEALLKSKQSIFYSMAANAGLV